MDAISSARILRTATEKSCIQIPGAPNALVARLVERMGFDAVYLDGAACAAGVLGLPDTGLMTLTELVQQATYLTRNVSLPVVVDAEAGFGNTENVERTIEELEQTGVAAIQIDDQLASRRDLHVHGKSLISSDAMCDKIRAAADTRIDPDLVLIARTASRSVNGLQDAIERARRYVDAGADWIVPDALTSRDEFEQFARAVDVPLVANLLEFNASPLLRVDELAELGYAAAIYPLTLLRIFLRAAEASLATLAEQGTQRELLDLMQTPGELHELLDYSEFSGLEPPGD